MTHKKIIIAPLNWGLGHATRCISIINVLIENNFVPIIASDGKALLFLQKEFPNLEFIELPSYNIEYSKNLKWNLLLQTPKIIATVKKEQQIIEKYVENNTVVGIISDNRFGVRNAKVPSVYITHQVNVLSGWSTFITSKIHQNIIKKFDECWIPDTKKSTFSGKLSSTKNKRIKNKFIGVLSRFEKKDKQITNDVLIILSGPEPHRTSIENKLLTEFKNYPKKVVLVQGVVEKQQIKSRKGNIIIYNYLLSDELQNEINSSKLIICRSGYSSILDLAKLGKKAFFIPTPNQTEQEYLAKHLEMQMIAPYTTEIEFKLELIEKVNNYKGFEIASSKLDDNLFNLFERKSKS